MVLNFFENIKQSSINPLVIYENFDESHQFFEVFEITKSNNSLILISSKILKT